MSIAKELMKRVLFTRLPENPNRVKPVESRNTTIFIMLKRQSNLPQSEFFHQLLTTVASQISNTQKKLGYVSFRQFHDVSMGGVLMAPFIFARSSAVSHFLCTISGVTPAAPFSVNYKPHFDALLELQFDTKLSSQQIEILKHISDSLHAIASSVVLNESDRRFTVYENGRSDIKNPVHITVLTRCPSGKTRQQAQDYWINQHAKLVVDNVSLISMIGYDQVHTVREPSLNFENPYEGVAFITYKDIKHFLSNYTAGMETLRFNNTLVVDEIQLTVNSDVLLLREYQINNSTTLSN